MFADPRAAVRALFADDPSLGLTLTGPLPALPTQRAVPSGRVPVVLFEPPLAVTLEDDAGQQRDAHCEAAITFGMLRCLPGPARAEQVPGWTVRQTDVGLELAVGGETVRAQGPVDLEPDWLRAAETYQQVVVLYGPLLGVRVPSRTTAAGYTDIERRTELDQARRAGQVAYGVLKWVPSGVEPPGFDLLDLSHLGITPPVFAFPLDELLAQGGPEVFGFEHFGKRDPAVPLPMTDALAVDLHKGLHDIDVLDMRHFRTPAEPPLLVGLRSPQPRPDTFDARAAAEGQVLLLATSLNVRTHAVADVLISSYVCLAPLLLRAYPGGIGTRPPPTE